MWKMLPLIGILLFGCIHQSEAQNPGLVLNITANGLNEVSGIIDQQLQYFWATNPVIYFPDVYLINETDSNGDPVNITITNMTLSNLHCSTSCITVTVDPKKNLTIAINNFMAVLTMNLTFVTADSVNNTAANATISEFDIYTYVNLFASSSGALIIEAYEMDVNIVLVLPSLPPKTVKLVEKAIESELPVLLLPVINATLANTTLKYLTNPIQYLDPYNLTVLNMSLLRNPEYVANGIQFYLKGDVYSVFSPNQTCKLSPAPIDYIYTDDFRIFLSETIIQCYIMAMDESHLLNAAINLAVSQYINLTVGFGLYVNVSNGDQGQFYVTENATTVILTLQTNWVRYGYLHELYIIIGENVTISLQLSLAARNNSILLCGQIYYIKTGLSVPYYADDLPPNYVEGIQNAKFDELSAVADKVLSTIVIPAINANFAIGFPIITDPSVALIENIRLEEHNGFFFLAISLV